MQFEGKSFVIVVNLVVIVVVVVIALVVVDLVVVVVFVVDLVVDLADSGCELEESLRADPTERRSESGTLPTPGDPLYNTCVHGKIQNTTSNT